MVSRKTRKAAISHLSHPRTRPFFAALAAHNRASALDFRVGGYVQLLELLAVGLIH